MCTEAEVQRLLPLVSEQRREQALRYKHTLGRFCCLKSWLIWRELSGEGLPVTGDGLWTYNEHGKPYIEGGPYFSLSHCKAGIAVAVDDKPIGIDMENIRHADDALIARTMNTDEQLQIAQADDRDRAFTRLWTQKEAVVKMQGTGIESFEQLQNILSNPTAYDCTGIRIKTVEENEYIYSIAYKY